MNKEEYVLFNNVIQKLLQRYIYPMQHYELCNKVQVCCYLQYMYWDYIDNYVPKYSFCPKWSEEDFICFILRYTTYLQPYFKYEPIIEYKQWSHYVSTIPVFGTILLDKSRKYCLLLRVNFGHRVHYDFPKGKINIGESPIDCAIRETMEESGIDISSRISEHCYIEDTIRTKKVRLYIVEGISKKTKFKPLMKGECNGYEWVPIRKIKMGIKWRGICKRLLDYIDTFQNTKYNKF